MKRKVFWNVVTCSAVAASKLGHKARIVVPAAENPSKRLWKRGSESRRTKSVRRQSCQLINKSLIYLKVEEFLKVRRKVALRMTRLTQLLSKKNLTLNQ